MDSSRIQLSKPTLAHVIPLLKAADLITDDLTEQHLQHFRMLHDAMHVHGIVGLELLPDCALLRSLVVDKNSRGQSIGRRLVEIVEDHARAINIGDLYLLTTDADVFFSHLNYQVVPRECAPTAIKDTPQFSTYCPGTAIVMHKSLNNTQD